eukprot:scaffold129232_cov44-Prasinocladus_malaysianus.AAC.3
MKKQANTQQSGALMQGMLTLALLEALEQTLGALVARVVVVQQPVEEATDLVDPRVAVVALHPGLLLDVVVLLLEDVALG